MESYRLINFWKKVDKSKECWEWKAALNEAGYGIFGIKNKKVDRAHRISYRLHYGEIPQGMFVCHKCDNRKCVNPEHLFLGTNQDNIDDMLSKQRNSKPPNMGGWNRYNYSKEIIELLGKKPDTEIASLAGVSKYAIAYERKRRNISPFPCQTRFKKGNFPSRWHKRKEV